jgi:glycosyltransferase domain-containing protein
MKLDPGKLAFVVPTRNRPQFLRRLLCFMSQFPSQGTVLIADSSDRTHRGENQELVRQFSQKLEVRYEFIDQNIIAKCVTAIGKLDTPYIAFCADDDFLMPAAVAEGVNFLETNAGYACAQGLMVSVISSRNNRCDLIRGFEIDSESVLERYDQMSRYWYSTYYAVYHTAILRESFRVAVMSPRYEKARIYPELMHSLMTVLQGKVKFLNQIYNVRQEHAGNESCVAKRVQDLANGVTYYKIFRNLLCEKLGHYAAIGKPQAWSLVDQHYESLTVGRASRGGLDNVRREVLKGIRKIANWFQNDSILERCRFGRSHSARKDPAWQLAYRLIQSYPQGMCHAELIAEQPAIAEAAGENHLRKSA